MNHVFSVTPQTLTIGTTTHQLRNVASVSVASGRNIDWRWIFAVAFPFAGLCICVGICDNVIKHDPVAAAASCAVVMLIAISIAIVSARQAPPKNYFILRIHLASGDWQDVHFSSAAEAGAAHSAICAAMQST
jgi:hypothetical protein